MRERFLRPFSQISRICKYSINIRFSIREYIAKGRDLQVDRRKIPPCCSNTHRHRHGFYLRQASEYGEILILRFFCVNCRRTTSLLPTFLTPLKWHSTDTIYTCLMFFIILNNNVLDISFKQGISPSTFYRWYSQFLYNSTNFQLEEYRLRLGRRFTVIGFSLFQALVDFFKDQLHGENDAPKNTFISLQQSLASPFFHKGQYLPSLGIFRTVLDRGS